MEQSAVASLTIKEADMTVTAEMVLTLVAGVTAANIHSGLAGMSGGGLVGLEQDGAEIAVWLLPSYTTLSEAELVGLLIRERA